MVNKKIITLLKKYISLLKTEGISVERAYLYGSYSTGLATDNSDIDIMIVTNNEDAEDNFIIGKIWNLTRKINTKIEPFLVGNDRFHESNNSALIDIISRSLKIQNYFGFSFFNYY